MGTADNGSDDGGGIGEEGTVEDLAGGAIVLRAVVFLGGIFVAVVFFVGVLLAVGLETGGFRAGLLVACSLGAE